jgi:hypothetical protein
VVEISQMNLQRTAIDVRLILKWIAKKEEVNLIKLAPYSSRWLLFVNPLMHFRVPRFFSPICDGHGYHARNCDV